jgi:predicted membrane protein
MMLFLTICAWLLLTVFMLYLTWILVDYHSQKAKIIASVTLFLCLAFTITFIVRYEQKYPCLKYETTMQYDPATKMMRPMRICTQRGEWVE